MMEALKNHTFFIFLDADAIFSEPTMPRKYRLNFWNIHDEIVVAAAEDIYERPTSIARDAYLEYRLRRRAGP